MVSAEANELLAELIREKIRSIVHDPATAELLCPKDHPFGTKRPCVDTNYYATYNLPHVRLVDLRSTPIATVTETGIDTTAESFEFDALVLATGFDAMTGAIVKRRHHRPRRAHPEVRVGRRPAHLSRPHVGRIPQPVHDHRPRQPVRCCRTWRCRSSNNTSSG
ncbi:MAG: hypothetical protein R2713_15610 [Ilumatobacteraceae bacterium]